MLKWGFAALNLVLYIVMLVLAIVFVETTSVRRPLLLTVEGVKFICTGFMLRAGFP